MATPKLNRIIQEFQQRILDPVQIDTGVIQPGIIVVDVRDMESYVSIGMLKMMEDLWYKVERDKQKFIRLIGELQTEKSVSIGITATGAKLELNAANLLLDFYFPLPSYKTPSTKIDVWDSAKISDIRTGFNPFYVATANQPAMVDIENYLYVFPGDIAATAPFTFNLVYCKKPINPATGDILRSGGSYDSPFHETREDLIAELAKEHYYKHLKQQTG